jgi:hypothetical protein
MLYEIRLANGKVVNMNDFPEMDKEERLELLRAIKTHILKYGDSDDLRGLAHEVCISLHDLGLYDKIRVEEQSKNSG